jgi:hypothetical protein
MTSERISNDLQHETDALTHSLVTCAGHIRSDAGMPHGNEGRKRCGCCVVPGSRDFVQDDVLRKVTVSHVLFLDMILVPF